MDRASFELIGNVGKLDIKPTSNGKKLAIISLATSERWKTESGDWNEKTYWHRVVVFAPAKVKLIESAVQKGTRLRLVGQIRPGSWEDERGQTRYTVEFVVTGFGEVEILARGKPKAETPDADGEPAPAGEEAPKARRKRAA
jgi:single-strand DNA-binding protein